MPGCRRKKSTHKEKRKVKGIFCPKRIEGGPKGREWEWEEIPNVMEEKNLLKNEEIGAAGNTGKKGEREKKPLFHEKLNVQARPKWRQKDSARSGGKASLYGTCFPGKKHAGEKTGKKRKNEIQESGC